MYAWCCWACNILGALSSSFSCCFSDAILAGVGAAGLSIALGLTAIWLRRTASGRDRPHAGGAR